MTTISAFTRLAAALALFCSGLSLSAADKSNETEPKVIDPGPPPADAIVLFDGKDLSKWQSEKGDEAKWRVENGVMIVNSTGSIMTKEEFGDVQLHVEWATPSEVKGDGQGRGNSGVYLQGRYEIQVLDSYNNKTYFNGPGWRVLSPPSAALPERGCVRHAASCRPHLNKGQIHDLR